MQRRFAERRDSLTERAPDEPAVIRIPVIPCRVRLLGGLGSAAVMWTLFLVVAFVAGHTAFTLTFAVMAFAASAPATLLSAAAMRAPARWLEIDTKVLPEWAPRLRRLTLRNFFVSLACALASALAFTHVLVRG